MSVRPKFSVVREDAALEVELVRRTSAREVLVVASGGCTALTLRHLFPSLGVTAFDLNPAQLAHVRAKADAVTRGDLAALNVGDANPGALNQGGHFEGLFRVLRHFLLEFVLTGPELDTFFNGATSAAERHALVERWTASSYWPAAFAVTFTDGFLHAMFGPAATQHAEPGSYPGYFQRVFERGLRREGAASNPFLQHVLLGCYRRDSAPEYTRAGGPLEVHLVEGSLMDVPALGRFDVISLSNIFDWSDDALVERWAGLLAREAKPGCAVLLRQLNNRRDLRRFFAPAFSFDDALSVDFLARDRSLFYERFEVGFHTGRR
ncbi:DUF3419 family protein [Myxococcaceae bacterium GXIMD 01537]